MEEQNLQETTQIVDNKFLTFKIGHEQYGLGIEYVIEIIEMIKITPMPEAEPYMKGVINLRGKVIPVMDIRLRFGMDERKADPRTCIIVVKVDDLEIGLIVDTVSEVVDIPQEHIEDPPKLQKQKEQRFVMGMGKIDDDVHILLDLQILVFTNSLLEIKQEVVNE